MNRDQDSSRRAEYRSIIDRLVADCSAGQGQVAPRRIRSGVWNQSASAIALPDQFKINETLARLDSESRSVMAKVAEECFVAGVHQTLVALHEAGVVPFDSGVEGSPFADFMGRLQGWDWPAL